MSDQNATQSSAHGERILLENITKRYPGQKAAAVDDVTMEIPAGEIVMLVGPSGCGKTTTMKMINRLIEPTSGTIRIGDEDVTNVDADDLRRRIGYVIQGAGLFPHYTVAENIAIVPKLLGWDRKRIAARVDELLELVSLDPAQYRDRFPRELSGGQQQRVGVARALAADPPVLLMDEPFGAVDPVVRVRLQEEFRALQRELGKTVVMVTHDIDEAVAMGDRVAVFAEGGRLAQIGTPLELLAHPADDQVAGFVGSESGLRRLSVVPLRVEDLEPLDGVTGGQLGAAIPLDSTLEQALAAMLREDKAMVGVRDGAAFVGVLTPTGVHRALRRALEASAATEERGRRANAEG